MSENPYIIHVGGDNFAAEVLERSQQVPVLVDFWAAWCAPCQMLMPVLEKLASAYAGALYVAKINSDEQQELAARYGIRSLPTLKLFYKGEAVEEMLGAQPEGELRRLVEPYIARPEDSIRDQAALLQTAGKTGEALALLRTALEQSPDYAPLHEDLLNLLLFSGQTGSAQEWFTNMPANLQSDAAMLRIKDLLDFYQIVENAPSRSELEALLSAGPDNHEARYQLSVRQIIAQEYSAAMDNLLSIMRHSRNFQDDAAHKALLAVFRLADDDKLVSRYRTKLSSVLY